MGSWKMVTLIERERERGRWIIDVHVLGLMELFFFFFLMWWSDNWENINLQKEGKEKEKEKSIIG